MTEQITQARQRRADHRPAGLAVGPGRPPDPQGQARQADGVRVRRSALRDHRQHQDGRARVHPAAQEPDREPGRGHAAARHRRRAASNLDIKLKEIMLDGGFTPTPTNTALDGPGRHRAHRRPPRDPAPRRTRRRRQRYRTGTEGRISHLKRGYGLRPITPQRRRRPPDLGRLGDPHLQRRDLHHPRMTPGDPETRGTGPGTRSRETRPELNPDRASPASTIDTHSPTHRVYPGQVASCSGSCRPARWPPPSRGPCCSARWRRCC